MYHNIAIFVVFTSVFQGSSFSAYTKYEIAEATITVRSNLAGNELSSWELFVLNDMLFQITMKKCPNINRPVASSLKEYITDVVKMAPQQKKRQDPDFLPSYKTLVNCFEHIDANSRNPGKKLEWVRFIDEDRPDPLKESKSKQQQIPQEASDLEQPQSLQVSSDLEQPKRPQEASNLEQPQSPQFSSDLEQTQSPQQVTDFENPKNSEEKSDLEQPKRPQISSDLEQPQSLQVSSDLKQPQSPQEASDLEQPRSPQEASDLEQPQSLQVSSDLEQPQSLQVSSDLEQPQSLQVSSDLEQTQSPQETSDLEQPQKFSYLEQPQSPQQVTDFENPQKSQKKQQRQNPRENSKSEQPPNSDSKSKDWVRQTSRTEKPVESVTSRLNYAWQDKQGEWHWKWMSKVSNMFSSVFRPKRQISKEILTDEAAKSNLKVGEDQQVRKLSDAKRNLMKMLQDMNKVVRLSCPAPLKLNRSFSRKTLQEIVHWSSKDSHSLIRASGKYFGDNNSLIQQIHDCLQSL